MAGTVSEESGDGRSLEGVSSGQQLCQSMEALAEWRSSEQVENGIASTSPPYWDTDDDDCGPKPSELYGKYTWKIDKFSQINKRELRSNAFEVGGYKWYILIYPQGCDVCNHLSLFLCVANHDKLLPGWSHFAQFTIAVVNKDPKKSKYSDTLHRFWKKEHDWGWKKFMELSKVLDGFIDGDTLIIKAQVQVIRERADRPFRCLDCQYRRELVRVYLTNVEQICRRFVEERRSKLGKLIEDKARWSSFCAFWMGIDQTVKRRMSREKTDAILRIIVKHFFIEKEVTSTLVMDSLYSGLKALEGQTKSKIGRGQLLDAEELPVPIICIERDMFVLVDDVLLLLERAAVEPLPPKDDKGPQNRMKDGCAGEEFNKDSIERDERRLTELGRRTIEIFVLAHVYSKIEVAYQEAVALKRQEELIREEAAWLAETEHKAKRGTADKDKKSKKKQAKQKRNNRKGKDKGRDEKPSAALQDKLQQVRPADERKDFMIEKAEPELEKHDIPEDVSDVSDSVECQPSVLQPDSEDRDPSPVNWDTDTSEAQPSTEACSSGVSGLSAVQNGMRERNSPSVVDDSSSTCSTDSVPSMKTSGPYKGNSLPNQKNQKSPRRGTNQGGRSTSDATGWANEVRCQLSEAMSDLEEPNDASGSCKVESESEAVVIKELEQHVMKKLEEVDSLQREKIIKDQADTEKPKKEKMTEAPSSPSSTRKTLTSAVRIVSESKSVATDPVLVRKPSSDSFQPTERPALMTSSAANIKAALSSDTHKAAAPKPNDKPLVQQVPVTSRPLSAPITPGPRPTAPIVSMVQTAQLLPRSVSAAGRLGPDTSSTTHSYVPQSYRNAIMGPPATQPHTPSSFGNPLHLYSQTSNLISPPILLPTSSERVELNMVKPGLPFGRVNHEVLQNGPQWTEPSQRDNSSRSMHYEPSSLHDGTHNNLDFYQPVHSRSQDRFPSELPASTSGRQSHGAALADDFPHLDIINDLLDDEQGIVRAAVRASASFQGFSNEPRPHHLNRQFSFPGEIGMSNNDMSPSTSSGRFERTRSYRDDGFQQHGYGSLQGHFDFESLRQAQAAAAVAAAHPIPYVNGQQIDGLIANHRHWQISGSEMPSQSHLGTRNMDGDGIGGGYPYHHNIPDYSNPASSSSLGGGYGVLPPSNGH
ncbi:TNF receptor-associated factor homolog 1b-like [Diospyros lotus]|uniref:TNF receptor-associated factor homolog 1b-like n=1 Tax=Diospyros lotus TaxID=55363 RepID=UPI00224DE7AA|nr:TNF receptor-associated factor homolog 1b-like [Diospyros lotus]